MLLRLPPLQWGPTRLLMKVVELEDIITHITGGVAYTPNKNR